MKTRKELSAHDKEIVRRIEEINQEWGWIRWPDISALAEELEDMEERNAWDRVCIRYNHLEEASAGML